MEKVLITGSKGKIGRIINRGLKDDYKLTLLDLPEFDVREYEKLSKISLRHNAIIHLAWDTKKENFQSRKTSPDNSLMFENAYRLALERRIPKVIMASSIHADNFQNYSGGKLMLPTRKPSPQNPYGKHKVDMENLGKKYSKKGLEVVCIRFGAVGYEVDKSKEGRMVWLSNNDCVNLIKIILEAPKIPNNFLIINGVSNNKSRIHDYTNPLGWKPKDDSSKF